MLHEFASSSQVDIQIYGLSELGVWVDWLYLIFDVPQTCLPVVPALRWTTKSIPRKARSTQSEVP